MVLERLSPPPSGTAVLSDRHPGLAGSVLAPSGISIFYSRKAGVESALKIPYVNPPRLATPPILPFSSILPSASWILRESHLRLSHISHPVLVQLYFFVPPSFPPAGASPSISYLSPAKSVPGRMRSPITWFSELTVDDLQPRLR